MSELQKVMDLFGSDGIELVKAEDSAGLDFDTPIKGKYLARIVEMVRRVGTSEKSGKDYDFYALKLQVEDDVEGDKSGKRYLDKTFFNGVSDYNEDADKGVKDLFNALFTAELLDKVEFTSTDKYLAAEEIAPQLVDKLIKVSAYKGKTGKQVVKIVNEFKLTKKKEDAGEDASGW